MKVKSDFDVNAFIQEQDLEIEDDVKLLLNADLDLKDSKKKKAKSATLQVRSDSEEQSDSDLEMMAYNEMMALDEEMQEKVYINRTEALESRLHDINQELDWIETLVITAKETNSLSKEEISDDLKRELTFYEQALNAVKEAKVKIEDAGVVFTRPDDYFAEMVKSDDHMKKVKQRLLDEAQALKASEMARKQREAKKFGKKVQLEKLAQREKKARDETEKIKLARKKMASKENMDDEFDIDVLNDSKKSSQKKTLNKKSGKRVNKDKKFGFGGQKRNRKSNTAESTADMGGFSVKKMKKRR